jgi:hypothetical protein
MTSTREELGGRVEPLAPPELGSSVLAESHLPLRRREKMLIWLEGFLSMCGLGGGFYLFTKPWTAMPLSFLDGTWFNSWRWPGMALFAFVGICPALAAVATLRRMPISIVGHLCVGTGLLAWLVLEAAWVVVSPPLQILMGLVGVSILWLAIAELNCAKSEHRRN